MSENAGLASRARGKGPAPVTLGTAGDFVILSKSGITDVHASAVAGNVGTSPITGALPKNIFWQVAGAMTIGTTAHFEGVALAKTLIAASTGASVPRVNSGGPLCRGLRGRGPGDKSYR